MLSPIDGTFTSFSAEKNRTDIMFGVAVPKEELGERVKRRWGEKKSGGEGSLVSVDLTTVKVRRALITDHTACTNDRVQRAAPLTPPPPWRPTSSLYSARSCVRVDGCSYGKKTIKAPARTGG